MSSTHNNVSVPNSSSLFKLLCEPANSTSPIMLESASSGNDSYRNNQSSTLLSYKLTPQPTTNGMNQLIGGVNLYWSLNGNATLASQCMSPTNEPHDQAELTTLTKVTNAHNNSNSHIELKYCSDLLADIQPCSDFDNFYTYNEEPHFFD